MSEYLKFIQSTFPSDGEALAGEAKMLLCKAACDGDLDAVKWLLSFQEVRKSASVFDNHILKGSIKCGHSEVVKKFFEVTNVITNIEQNNDWHQLLKYAVVSGNIDTVNYLLRVPAVENSIDIRNNLIIKKAIECGHAQIVDRLLQFDKVMNNISANGNRILFKAIKKNHLNITNRLLNIQSVIEEVNNNPYRTIKAAVAAPGIAYRLMEIPSIRQCVCNHNDNNIMHKQLEILSAAAAIKSHEVTHMLASTMFPNGISDMPLAIRNNKEVMSSIKEYSKAIDQTFDLRQSIIPEGLHPNLLHLTGSILAVSIPNSAESYFSQYTQSIIRDNTARLRATLKKRVVDNQTCTRTGATLGTTINTVQEHLSRQFEHLSKENHSKARPKIGF